MTHKDDIKHITKTIHEINYQIQNLDKEVLSLDSKRDELVSVYLLNNNIFSDCCAELLFLEKEYILSFYDSVSVNKKIFVEVYEIFDIMDNSSNQINLDNNISLVDHYNKLSIHLFNFNVSDLNHFLIANKIKLSKIVVSEELSKIIDAHKDFSSRFSL